MIPVGSVKAFMKLSGLKFISVQSKVVYRYMTEAELKAVQIFGRLKGDWKGPFYFTDDIYNTAKEAKSKLSLSGSPTIRVKVRVKNDPKTLRRDSVKGSNGESGGGTEMFTDDSVFVDVLESINLN